MRRHLLDVIHPEGEVPEEVEDGHVVTKLQDLILDIFEERQSKPEEHLDKIVTS